MIDTSVQLELTIITECYVTVPMSTRLLSLLCVLPSLYSDRYSSRPDGNAACPTLLVRVADGLASREAVALGRASILLGSIKKIRSQPAVCPANWAGSRRSRLGKMLEKLATYHRPLQSAGDFPVRCVGRFIFDSLATISLIMVIY